MLDNFMTVKEVSSTLNLSTGHVRQLCIKGHMPDAQKVGNTWIIPKTSVQNYKPGKKGFAAVWDKKRDEKQKLKDTIQAAISEASQPPADKDNSKPEQE